MMDIVDMCKRQKELTLDFQLNVDKWNTVNQEVKDIVSTGWEKIKFLNEEGRIDNQDILKVPDNMGGVYVFLLQPDIIPNMHLYIMYIGRARRKTEFSLRKRCKAYLKDTRPQIAYMREVWGKNLYFYYLPLENDDTIDKVEKELIRVIIPPCNSQIPDQYVDVMPEENAF
ncbi:MAG: hypothetical protein J1E98_11250 [Lachnospiraceae bacterium]|nr:hypothetical protein [Lachnospiraceae bacterium]